eukprot:TRINITY_DN1608_c0_g1_i2.p1 TRINITY_DN1608_c0_g1~~TRINITY_DN1608_c0_g1_i2.p1  ORF type:complete len:824 (+),score=362.19 TRINITY_DN1608_c0_g1_i2:165-2636(+)
MEYEFLDLDGCSPEEARRLCEILSISSPPPPPFEQVVPEGPMSYVVPPPAQQQQQPQAASSPYPNVYINNVTANVSLSVPPEAGAGGLETTHSGPPPLLTYAAGASPMHHLLLPGYNVSLSLPPPPVVPSPASHPPPPIHPNHPNHPMQQQQQHPHMQNHHPHHRPIPILRNHLMDMPKTQFYIPQNPRYPHYPNPAHTLYNHHPHHHHPTANVLFQQQQHQQVQQQQQTLPLEQHPPLSEYGGHPQQQTQPLPEQLIPPPSTNTTLMTSSPSASVVQGDEEEKTEELKKELEEEEEEDEEQQQHHIEVEEVRLPTQVEAQVDCEEVLKPRVPSPTPSPPPVLSEEAKPPQKSWASLFRSSQSGEGSNASVEPSEKPTARISPNNAASLEDCSSSTVASSSTTRGVPQENESVLSTKEGQLGEFLRSYSLNHRSFTVKPRGLSNRSNWCFANAILQALLGCPPFFNLIRALPPLLLEKGSILSSLSEFMAEFSPMEKAPAKHRRNKKPEDLNVGPTFEASSIFRILLSLPPTETFKVVEGRQEDAEEFLTFLLNRVNDEMLALLKKLDEDPQNKRKEDNMSSNNNNDIDEGDPDDWKEVGPKNKGTVTRRQILGNTPLASMVQGQIRSCVTHSSSEPTATLQPFFTLQLDLQSESIRSVSDALLKSFSMESLDGYVCSKTNLEIEASRSLSIDDLPPVLILHLKRFIYNETSGGVQKLLKKIDFPIDLEISKEILSPHSKGKILPKQRHYKLFAVVYHNGGEATKGHYVTDVYHTGLASWIRCDDCNIKSVNEANVLAHTHNSMPYILFYRRGDTMMGPEKKN